MEIEVASSSSGNNNNLNKQRNVGGDDGGLHREFRRGTYLVWEDLNVVLPNFGNKPTKRLLQGLYGYAEPGRIMAIMGPSGSGKSTLLDSLAGLSRTPTDDVTRLTFTFRLISVYNMLS